MTSFPTVQPTHSTSAADFSCFCDNSDLKNLLLYSRYSGCLHLWEITCKTWWVQCSQCWVQPFSLTTFWTVSDLENHAHIPPILRVENENGTRKERLAKHTVPVESSPCNAKGKDSKWRGHRTGSPTRKRSSSWMGSPPTESNIRDPLSSFQVLWDPLPQPSRCSHGPMFPSPRVPLLMLCRDTCRQRTHGAKEDSLSMNIASVIGDGVDEYGWVCYQLDDDRW